MKPSIRQFELDEIQRIAEAKVLKAKAPEETPKSKKAAKKGGKQKKKKVDKPFEIQLFNIGDTVEVWYKIIEGDKEREQKFEGVVIRRKGAGLRANFTVRRIVAGEGVERIFPMHSPKLMKIIVTRRGKVRRAKLYYLRNRVGKATKTKELMGDRAMRLRKANEEHLAAQAEAQQALLTSVDTPEASE